MARMTSSLAPWGAKQTRRLLPLPLPLPQVKQGFRMGEQPLVKLVGLPPGAGDVFSKLTGEYRQCRGCGKLYPTKERLGPCARVWVPRKGWWANVSGSRLIWGGLSCREAPDRRQGHTEPRKSRVVVL